MVKWSRSVQSEATSAFSGLDDKATVPVCVVTYKSLMMRANAGDFISVIKNVSVESKGASILLTSSANSPSTSDGERPSSSLSGVVSSAASTGWPSTSNCDH